MRLQLANLTLHPRSNFVNSDLLVLHILVFSSVHVLSRLCLF
jgi:hypothetical protein